MPTYTMKINLWQQFYLQNLQPKKKYDKASDQMFVSFSFFSCQASKVTNDCSYSDVPHLFAPPLMQLTEP